MADAKLNIIVTAKDQTKGAFKGVKGSLQSIGGLAAKGLIVGLGATAAGIAGLGAAAVKLAMDSAPLEGVQNAFYGLADAAGVGGDAMLEALQKGSAGMATNRDLMTSFNKAAQLVSQDFAVQLPDAMQYLGKVAQATGQDMGFMIDSLVTGVGRMSPMILDNLGIQVQLSEATARAAEMFGVEASELSKAQQQAGLMDVVMEKLAKNTADMPDVVGSAQQQFESFKVALKNTKDEIGLALLPIITPLLGRLSELATKYIPVAIEWLERLLSPIEKLINVMLDFGIGSDQMRDALANMFGADVATQIMDIVKWIQDLAAVINEFMTNVLVPFIKEHWEELKAALITVGAILAAGAIVAGIAAIVGAIAALLNPIGLVVAAIGVLAAAWAGNWGGIRDKTMKAVEWIKKIIAKGLQFIQDFWAKHGETITAAAKLIWDNIKTIIDTVMKNIKLVQEAFQAAFAGDWHTFGEKLRQAWDNSWRLIKDILSKAWAAIKLIISTLITNIIDKFKTTDWGAVGRNIIQGIANGIKNSVSVIIKAAKNAAKAAFEAAKGFLGIDSPSRLFADLGKNMMEGIAQGISRNMEIPIKATVSAGQAMRDNATGQFSQTSSIANTRNYAYSRAGDNIYMNNAAQMAMWIEYQRRQAKAIDGVI